MADVFRRISLVRSCDDSAMATSGDGYQRDRDRQANQRIAVRAGAELGGMRVGRFWSIFYSDRGLALTTCFLVKIGERCVDDEDARSSVATFSSGL